MTGSSGHPVRRSICDQSSDALGYWVPGVVRTFWQGGVLGLYQRLALKSFADRGHRVEVFSYDPSLDLPRFVVVRDAADVLPPERVLRFLPAHGRFVVNIDLFRYALLAKFGGWWIDPDVVLLGDLPADEIFLAGPDEFGALSLAALRLPSQHPVAMIAEEVAAANAASVETWPNAGASFLAELAERHGLSSLLQSHARVAPVSRVDLPKLFDPAQAKAVIDTSEDACFLDLHYDVWLRAGVPVHSNPPDESLLHHLLQRHHIYEPDREQMNCGNLVQLFARMQDAEAKHTR